MHTFHEVFLFSILPTAGGIILGAFFGWNNPKAKIKAAIDNEIVKAIAGGKSDLQNALTVIKSKL